MKIIKFFNIQKFFFLICSSRNFLCFKKSMSFQYFNLPNFCILKKNIKNIIFFFNKQYILSKQLFFLFKISFFFFLQFIKFVNLKIYNILRLRGKGLSVFLEKSSKNLLRLELRLGFSMRIFLYVPVGLNIFFFKKKIIIEGNNKELVSSFSTLLLNYKEGNVYTGKGFWKYREKIVLRKGKKISSKKVR